MHMKRVDFYLNSAPQKNQKAAITFSLKPLRKAFSIKIEYSNQVSLSGVDGRGSLAKSYLLFEEQFPDHSQSHHCKSSTTLPMSFCSDISLKTCVRFSIVSIRL